MAKFLVINTSDDVNTVGSLRWAIDQAEQNGTGKDTITFDKSLKGDTITLGSTLTISSGTVKIDGDIDGDGDPDIIISGDANSSGSADSGDVGVLVEVASGATATLESLNFQTAYHKGDATFYDVYDGTYINAQDGVAGIVNNGLLTFRDSILQDVVAIGGDGSYVFAVGGLQGANAYAGIITKNGNLTAIDSYVADVSATGGNGRNYYFGGDMHAGDAYSGITVHSGTSNFEGVGIKNISAAGGSGGSAGSSTPGYNGGDGGDGHAGVNISGGVTSGYVQFSNVSASGGTRGNGFIPGATGSSIVNQASGNLGSVELNSLSSHNPGDQAFALLGSGLTIMTVQGDDTIGLGGGSSKVFSGSGNDYVNLGDTSFAKTGSGNDTVLLREDANGTKAFGGSGKDTLDASALSGTKITLNMKTGEGFHTVGGTPLRFTAEQFENFIGLDIGASVDDVSGTDGANNMSGLAGNDILSGLKGKDKINGGSGKDKIKGGKDDDILIGGSGKDKFIFAKKDGKDLIKDFENGKDKLDLTAFGFANKKTALKKFSELGKKNDDKVLFEANGTKIKINGLDLKDIDKGDILV